MITNNEIKNKRKCTMKKSLILMLVLLAITILSACSSSSNKDLLITQKTTQYFLDEEIPESDIKQILNAGINATSAMNKQNWYFSAVTNKELLLEFKNKMSENMPPQMKSQPNAKAQFGDSPLAIIVSCGDKGEYDAGLASQNLYDYAILSGYGAKIVSSPCKMINDNYKERLNIPSDMNAVAVVMIGKIKNMDSVDGVTSASVRKSFDEVVTIVK